MAGGSRRAAAAREGAHPHGRRPRPDATGAPLGTGRERVPLRHRRRWPNTAGALRRPLAAPDLPLHVRSELRCRLPDVLVVGRRRQRGPATPPRAGRDDALRLTSADREAPRLRGADGLELPVGLVRQQRLQLRPRLLVHRRAGERVRRAAPRGRSPVDPRCQCDRKRHGRRRLPDGGTGLQRVREGRRRRVSHVLNASPRPRVLDGLLPDPRSGTEGARRGRRDAALAPAARRVLDHSSRAGPDATGRRLIRTERGEEDGARGQGAGIVPRRATPRALRDDRS